MSDKTELLAKYVELQEDLSWQIMETNLMYDVVSDAKRLLNALINDSKNIATQEDAFMYISMSTSLMERFLDVHNLNGQEREEYDNKQ